MDNIKILFASDIHGNRAQYDKLFYYASKKVFDLIILGGDLTPKDNLNRTPQKQGEFIKKYLFKKIMDYKKGRKTQILIILGNDDFKSNEEIFKRNQDKGYLYIGQKSITYKNYPITGYCYVPITPFKYKDWEKLDLNNKREDRKDITITGLVNSSLEKNFYLKERNDTIENDLNKLVIGDAAILVSHGPPYNTHLDMLMDDRHVGSEALRKIIEKKKPLLVLSGHIHETVLASGKYYHKIGKTLCLCTGNDHLGKNLAILEIIIDPKKHKIFHKRLII